MAAMTQSGSDGTLTAQKFELKPVVLRRYQRLAQQGRSGQCGRFCGAVPPVGQSEGAMVAY